MGQNYSNISYKKTYTGDYIKSYKKHVYVYEPSVGEKKPSKDSVLAEGRRRTSRPEARTVARTPKVEAKKAEVKQKPEPAKTPAIEVKPKLTDAKPKPKPQITIEIPSVEAEIEKDAPPRLFDAEEFFNKDRNRQNVDPETIKYPVKHLHGSTYLDVFSGREVNEDRARELLHTAGFMPKTIPGIIPIFLGIIAVLFFGYFGIVPILLTGFWLFKKEDTTHSKVVGMEKLSLSMPATKHEMMIYKFQAAICFIVAMVSLFAKNV